MEASTPPLIEKIEPARPAPRTRIGLRRAAWLVADLVATAAFLVHALT